MIRFLLGDAEQTVTGVEPGTTVLEYLREMEQLKGTKEGCATGDCGACTVVLGELDGEKVRYRAANSCIAPLVSLHGKQLITIEHLQHAGGMHAVQQAMVDCHGSQCGFCTPGIVMSLFAHLKTHHGPQKNRLTESLGGNLCRCTGYSPILEAGIQMYDQPAEDQFATGEVNVVTRLKQVAAQTAVIELEAEGSCCYVPQSVEQLASLLQQHPSGKLLAGGTDLMLEITQNPCAADILFYTGCVKELLEINAAGGALEIGAAVTYSDCAQLLIEQYPDLQELIRRFGSQQIRNFGTLGGNIGGASPVGDMLPFLIVIGAELVLRSGDGTRPLGIENFFVSHRKTSLRSGEFIERILIPKARPGYLFKCYKVSKRLDDDTSSTCGAFYIAIEEGIVRDVRIAFGGMDEIPKRAKHCEDVLRGQTWNQATINRAMQVLECDFTPISDFRASAGYRMQASENMLQRLFLESSAPSSQLRITGRG